MSRLRRSKRERMDGTDSWNIDWGIDLDVRWKIKLDASARTINVYRTKYRLQKEAVQPGAREKRDTFTIDVSQIFRGTYIRNKVTRFRGTKKRRGKRYSRVVYLTRLFGDLRTIRRDINSGEKCTTIRGQDAALLHGKEGPVQQVHKQRCQRIRELGSRKEHAIANHHAAARLAHWGARCTPCCTRYVALFAIFLPRTVIDRHWDN